MQKIPDWIEAGLPMGLDILVVGVPSVG